MTNIPFKTYAVMHPTPFIGRQQEITDIQTRLNSLSCHVLTLTGLGGSGKTRLAIEVAHTIMSQFKDGIVFVDLQQIAAGDLLIHAIAHAVGLTFYGEEEPNIQLLNYLQDKSLLLLLDNFEQLLPETALVSAIVAQAPHVKILITSREALNLQEEWLYPVTGMSLPLSAYAKSLDDYDAIRLFLYHARRIEPDFDLEPEWESVAFICRMAAGLPLAIELAASWLRGLTASQIASETRHFLDILSTTTRNIDNRHSSMRGVFDHSWKLMSENERRIFAGLSVFRGSFDSVAAEQVVGAPLLLVAALVEKSLIVRDSANRFRMHDLLRQYAVEKLEERGDTETLYARHSAYFAQALFGYEGTLKQTQQFETMHAIESDFENIRFAWEWSVRNQQIAQLHHMLNGLYMFGFLGNRHLEIIDMFRQTLAQSVPDVRLKGRLLARRWGFLHWWYQLNYQETLTSLEQALEIAIANDDRFEIAFSHLMIAYALGSIERDVDALPHLEKSKALFEELGEPFYVCWVLSRLAYVYFDLNHYDEAFEYARQCLSLARIVRNRFALMISLYFFGLGSILRGDYINGKYYASEALQNANELGQRCQIAHALSLFALYAFCQGDFASCQAYSTQAWTLVEDIASLIFQPQSLSLLILLACLRTDYAEGVRLRELGIHHGTNAIDLQLRYWSLAMLSCGLGNREDTRLYIAKTLRLTEGIPQYSLLSWLAPAAIYALSNTDREHAVELLSWVQNIPDSTADWVRQWVFFDHLQGQLKAEMGQDSYQAYWERGRALTFDAANIILRREFVPSADANAESVEQGLLTRREIEILRLIATGLTNPQIANELVIGAATVKTHTLNIYRKLEAANRTQAIVRAQELGLLPQNLKISTTNSTNR